MYERRTIFVYLAITDGEFMWYQFDPEQGDVQMGKLRLAAASRGLRGKKPLYVHLGRRKQIYGGAFKCVPGYVPRHAHL